MFNSVLDTLTATLWQSFRFRYRFRSCTAAFRFRYRYKLRLLTPNQPHSSN